MNTISISIETSTYYGFVLIAQSEIGVCAVLMGDSPDDLRRDVLVRFPHTSLVRGEAHDHAVALRVMAFIEDPSAPLDVSLDMRGTDFQQSVWNALRDIPRGSTVSYTDIANRIGKPTAVRAVAHACAANPLAILVPCHRVVRNDGGLSGYRWGMERKRMLLEREKALFTRSDTTVRDV